MTTRFSSQRYVPKTPFSIITGSISSTGPSTASSTIDLELKLLPYHNPYPSADSATTPRFIQVIGYSGCGKSTLAKKLADHYHLPILHLDNVHWHGNWEERSHNEEEWLIKAFLKENEDKGWVIDGDYFKAAPERFYYANLTILLEFNRFWCWWSCFKRWREWKGKTRETCPCTEKFDWESQKWILWTGRKETAVKQHEKIMGNGRGEKLRFKSRKELLTWLDGLDQAEMSVNACSEPTVARG